MADINDSLPNTQPGQSRPPAEDYRSGGVSAEDARRILRRKLRRKRRRRAERQYKRSTGMNAPKNTPGNPY